MIKKIFTKKILFWSGISLGGLLLATGLWLLILYIQAGSTYEKKLESLLPKETLMLVKLDKLQVRHNSLLQRVEEVVQEISSTQKFEQSSWWHNLITPEKSQALVPTLEETYKQKVRNQLQRAELQISSMPGSPDLYEDLIGQELQLAVLSEPQKHNLYPLLLARVSKKVRFAWNFRSFATGKHGNLSITKTPQALKIEFFSKQNSSDQNNLLFLTLFDDVLALTTSKQGIEEVQKLYEQENSKHSLAEHRPYQETSKHISKLQKKNNAWIQAFANLDALRDYQQRHKQSEAETNKVFDAYFSIPPEILQTSPEILPTVDTLLKKSFDSEVFSTAGWSFDLSQDRQILVDQILVVEDQRLQKRQYLKHTWQLEQTTMNFLNLLPHDTWALVTHRQPLKKLAEIFPPLTDSKPPAATASDQKQEPAPNAIQGFLDSLGEEADANSLGMAFLDMRFAPPASIRPPKIISDIAWPPFLLFFHWPGVSMKDAEKLVQEQLQELKAQRLSSRVLTTPQGDPYVSFVGGEDDPKLNFLNQFAIFPIEDYLIISYSRNHTAVSEVHRLAQKKLHSSLAEKRGSPFSYLEDKLHSALVYLEPEGFQNFTRTMDLVKVLGDARYNSARPYGKEARDWRIELAQDMKLAPEDWKVGQAYLKLKERWLAEKQNYLQELQKDLHSLETLNDFIALTRSSTRFMHTHYQIRLKE